MKTLLRLVLEGQKKAESSNQFDVWHDGRFFDEWVSYSIIRKLDNAYGAYNKASILHALENTMELFSDEARTLAEYLGYTYPGKAEQYSIEQVKRLNKGCK